MANIKTIPNTIIEVLFASQLSLLGFIHCDRIIGTFEQMSGHQNVKRGHQYKRDGIIDKEFEEHYRLGIQLSQLLRKGVTHLYGFGVCDEHFRHKGVISTGNGH